MTVFRVGQRVRIVRSHYANRVGREARITSISKFSKHRIHGLGVYCLLDVDGIGQISPETGTVIAYRPDDLEPILDQHQPCESEFKESLDRMLERIVENVR